MFKNNFNKKNNFQQMKINGRCPVCQSMYDFAKLEVLGEKDHSLLLYMECTKCGASVISILSMKPNGMMAKAMVTDLSPEEVIKLGHEEAVSSDDALNMHEILREDKPVDNFIN